MKNLLIGLALASSLLAACTGSGGNGNPAVIPGGSTTSTGVLQTQTLNGAPAFVTGANMPVYTFGGDTTANQSACTGGCLAVWPPVIAAGGTLPAPWASFTRSDTAAQQLSYTGKPLYTFVNDSPGIARGDGVNNFHLARP